MLSLQWLPILYLLKIAAGIRPSYAGPSLARRLIFSPFFAAMRQRTLLDGSCFFEVVIVFRFRFRFRFRVRFRFCFCVRAFLFRRGALLLGGRALLRLSQVTLGVHPNDI